MLKSALEAFKNFNNQSQSDGPVWMIVPETAGQQNEDTCSLIRRNENENDYQSINLCYSLGLKNYFFLRFQKLHLPINCNSFSARIRFS